MDTSQLDERYVKKTRDTMTGSLIVRKENENGACVRIGVVEVGSDEFRDFDCIDSNEKRVGVVRFASNKDNTNELRLCAVVNNYRSIGGLRIIGSQDSESGAVVLDKQFTPQLLDNSTQIATTAWVNAAPSVVHTSGNETIDGLKTFSRSVTVANTNPLVVLKNDSLEKGITPSKTVVTQMSRVTDKNSTTLGYIGHSVETNGSSSVGLASVPFSTTGTTATLLVGNRADGETFTQAPTPPLLDNSTQIATTAWCRNFSLKIPLTKNTDFYVDGTAGSDVVDEGRGLSPDKPFKSISKCVDYIASNISLLTYNIVIYVSEGTYAERVVLPYYERTTGYITIQGAGKDATVVEKSDVTGVFYCAVSSVYYLRDMTVRCSRVSSTSSSAMASLHLQSGAKITVNNMHLECESQRSGGCYVMNASSGSIITIGSGCSLKISGTSGTLRALIATDSSSIVMSSSLTVYESKVTTFLYLARCAIFRKATSTGVVISTSGTVTGQRYKIEGSSSCSVFGLGNNFFPGDAAGECENGSSYS